MTYYTRITAKVEVSENSDYSEPLISRIAETTASTHTNFLHFPAVLCSTFDTIVWDASEYSWDPDYVLIKNLDTTNFVIVVGHDSDGTESTNTLQPGELVVLPARSSTLDITVTGDTGACFCEVLIVGS